MGDSENKPSASKPFEIIIIKHIPNRATPYTPADRIIARHSWGPGEGLDYATVFRDLNEETAQDIREWSNPATTLDSSTEVQTSSTATRQLPRSANSAKSSSPISQQTETQPTLATPASQPSSTSTPPSPRVADPSKWKTTLKGMQWIFGDDPEAEELVKAIRARPDGTLTIGVFQYKVSTGKDGVRLFVNRWKKSEAKS